MRALYYSLIALFVTGCSSHKGISENAESNPPLEIVKAPVSPRLNGVRAMPFAYIYKTNGNYDNNVCVGYDRQSETFISFPAPSDISTDSAPLKLVDGWLLDRQGGISTNTCFLKWTYQQYHELGSVPDIKTLREAIIPEAKVTEVVRLDMTSFAAQEDTAAVNKIIREMYSR